MFEELEVIELTHNIKEYSLKEGDRGTILEIYKNGAAYEVEFVESDGGTKALLTLMPEDIRPWKKKNEKFSYSENEKPAFLQS